MANSIVRVKIVKVDNQGVWVKPELDKQCHACAQSLMCEQRLKTTIIDSKPMFISDASQEYTQGETAKLHIAQTKLAAASLILYGLPLLLMLLGALFSQPLKSDVVSLIFIIVGLLLGLFSAKYLKPYYFSDNDLTLIKSLQPINLYKE